MTLGRQGIDDGAEEKSQRRIHIFKFKLIFEWLMYSSLKTWSFLNPKTTTKPALHELQKRCMNKIKLFLVFLSFLPYLVAKQFSLWGKLAYIIPGHNSPPTGISTIYLYLSSTSFFPNPNSPTSHLSSTHHTVMAKITRALDLWVHLWKQVISQHDNIFLDIRPFSGALLPSSSTATTGSAKTDLSKERSCLLKMGTDLDTSGLNLLLILACFIFSNTSKWTSLVFIETKSSKYR